MTTELQKRYVSSVEEMNRIVAEEGSDGFEFIFTEPVKTTEPLHLEGTFRIGHIESTAKPKPKRRWWQR